MPTSIIKKVKSGLNLKGSKKHKYRDYMDEGFPDLFQKYSDSTMVPAEAVYQSYSAAKYVAQNHLPGSIVECGVYKGGCSAIMAEASALPGCPERDLYLFDTYAGMTPPGENDFTNPSQETLDVTRLFEQQQSGDHNDWCYGSLDAVRETLKRTGLPQDRFHLVVGDVLKTIPHDGLIEIAILRLDTDWYESTKHELVHLYDKVVPGGVIIIDDYNYWHGARLATDEFLDERGLKPMKFFSKGRMAFMKVSS